MCLLEGSINWLINRKYKNLLKERKAREKTSCKWTEKERGLYFSDQNWMKLVGFVWLSKLKQIRLLLSASTIYILLLILSYTW